MLPSADADVHDAAEGGMVVDASAATYANDAAEGGVAGGVGAAADANDVPPRAAR